jgi:chorismate mutase
MNTSGTVSGAGTLQITSTSSGPGTTGTLNAKVRYNGACPATTVDARTYGGDVEFYVNSPLVVSASATMASGTYNFNANLYLNAVDVASIFLEGTTNNPTVNVAGNVDYLGVGAGVERIETGTGTWTVSGNVDFTDGQVSAAAGNTLVMNGTSKTLTSNGQTLQNVTLSGSITLANATHTMAGNFSMAGGTITPGTSTITMTGTSNTITGGGQTLYDLSIDPSSTGTITLQTSDVTVSNILVVSSSDTLSIASGRTLSSPGTTTILASGIVSGAGTLRFTDTSSGPGAVGTLSCLVRFDATANNVPSTTLDARTYGGNVEFYSSSASARTITAPASGTFTFSGNLTLTSSGGGVLTAGFDDITDPTVTITGNVSIGASTELQAPSSTTLSISGSFSNSGTFTHNSSTVAFIATSGPLNIDPGSSPFYNLTFNGSGGTWQPTTNTLTVANNLNVTVGTMDNETNDRILDVNGIVTIGASGVLQASSTASFTVAGNWANSGTFTSNTSTVTFDATSIDHTINPGLSPFTNVTFDGSGGVWSPLTNAMTVTGNLLMKNGMFDTSNGTANVTVNGNVQCSTTCGTITMNTAGTNTFTQSVATSKSFGTNVAVATNWTFYNLTFTASAGTPTITTNATGTGQIIVANALATTNSGTSLVVDNETNDRILDVNGAVTIGSGTTLQASSTAAFTVAGNWTNSGTFTSGTGTVTLDGSSQQTLAGTLNGVGKRFNNLIITNSSGSDPDTSPSVIFSVATDTAGTLTAATASTKLRFAASTTYTFQNIILNGQATGTRVALRSSTGGTQWNINVAGSRTVSNTDVKDSNACGQAPDIDATDGTNFDSIGNSCWQINTLTFAISDAAVGFGTLSSSAATWANGAATGSTSAVAAHTLAVTTNAVGGYVLTYFGPTLVGTETIDAATFTGDVDGTPNSKQFAMSITTDGNATIPSAYQKASNNYSFVPSTTTTLMSETGSTATETASVYYICNIASTTKPGAYSTDITYIVTSMF